LLITLNDILGKGFEGHHFIIGLAAHFRDLLVAKDAATTFLLEVDDKAKEQYISQAKSCSVSFLTQAIDLANTCDINFKTSKNQRLLVELTLMQLASIDFDSQKKKLEPKIIPAGTYKSPAKQPKPATKEIIQTAEPQEEYNKTEKTDEIVNDNLTNTKENTPSLKKVEKPTLNITRRGTSALSLKSLNEKTKIKDFEASNKSKEVLPEDTFTSDDFFKVWYKYLKYLDKKGEKLMLSILKAEKPKISGNTVALTLPNKVMQASFEKGKSGLLKYLRQELNNFKISIKVIVNEAVTKEYIYTSQEKYLALKKKNPHIELLKKTFKLDL